MSSDTKQPTTPRRLYVVTMRLRYLATDERDALRQHYQDCARDSAIFKLEAKNVEEDLQDVRLATPEEVARRKANLGGKQ